MSPEPTSSAPSAGPRSTADRQTDSRPRRTRRRRVTWSQLPSQWPLIVPLAGVVLALGFLLLDRWRRGALVLAAVAFLAAALRAFLPEHASRSLSVRGRWFDVAFLAAAGAVVLWLALSIDALGT